MVGSSGLGFCNFFIFFFLKRRRWFLANSDLLCILILLGVGSDIALGLITKEHQTTFTCFLFALDEFSSGNQNLIFLPFDNEPFFTIIFFFIII